MSLRAPVPAADVAGLAVRGVAEARRRAVACGVLLSLAMPLAAAGGRRIERTLAGRWGGPHAELTVGDDGARLEFDCAQGHIPGPLRLKADGRFDFKGTYRPERPGPQWEDEAPGTAGRAAARYQGRVEGSTMTLTVRSSAADRAELGTFTLTQGKPGALRKCL